jgi:hypothetical protein
VFESQRYLDLESHHFAHPLAASYTEQSTALLHQSCEPLLQSCGMGLEELDLWLRTSRHKRWMFWCGGDKCLHVQQERLNALYRAYDELTRTLETFRESLRFVISKQWSFLTDFTGIWPWSRIARLSATGTKDA